MKKLFVLLMAGMMMIGAAGCGKDREKPNTGNRRRLRGRQKKRRSLVCRTAGSLCRYRRMVYDAEDGQSLVERMESGNGLHTLEHAQDIGLGIRDYNLVSID